MTFAEYGAGSGFGAPGLQSSTCAGVNGRPMLKSTKVPSGARATRGLCAKAGSVVSRYAYGPVGDRVHRLAAGLPRAEAAAFRHLRREAVVFVVVALDHRHAPRQGRDSIRRCRSARRCEREGQLQRGDRTAVCGDGGSRGNSEQEEHRGRHIVQLLEVVRVYGVRAAAWDGSSTRAEIGSCFFSFFLSNCC